LSPYEAQFVRSGAVGKDLNGESILTMDLKAKDTKFVNITYIPKLKGDYGFNDQSNVEVTKQRAVFPKTAQAICAAVQFDYKLRIVGMGKNTIPEGDDHVVDVTGQKEMIVGLVSPQNIEFHSWEIVLGNIGSEKILWLDWKVNPKAKPQPDRIKFTSFEGAKAFLDWLMVTKSDKGAGRNFYLGPCDPNNPATCKPPTIQQIRLLRVIPRFENCMKTSNKCVDNLDEKIYKCSEL